MIETFVQEPLVPLSECKFCDTPIHWMHNGPTGALVAIEHTPVLYGETKIDPGSLVVILEDGETVLYPRTEREKNMLEWVYVCHKQTCPHYEHERVDRVRRYGSPEFYKFKQMRIAFNGASSFCERCGSTEGTFHMHELIYLPWDQMTVEDVEILCSECHAEEHTPSVTL